MSDSQAVSKIAQAGREAMKNCADTPDTLGHMAICAETFVQPSSRPAKPAAAVLTLCPRWRVCEEFPSKDFTMVLGFAGIGVDEVEAPRSSEVSRQLQHCAEVTCVSRCGILKRTPF